MSDRNAAPDPSPERPTARDPEAAAGRAWQISRVALGAVVLAWALLITWLFLAPTPETPRGGDAGRQAEAPARTPSAAAILRAALRPAGHGGLLGLYGRLGLLSGDSWNWQVSAQTWRDIAVGAGGLALMLAVGWLFLSCFEVYVPRAAAWALAFVMGIGLCGVVYTFVTLAGLLYQWLSLVVLAALLLVMAWRARRAWKRARLQTTHPDTNRYVSRRAQIRAALDFERRGWLRPAAGLEEILAGSMILLMGAITALTFYHALFFPETYWDSLILYLGYSRGIFEAKAFPVKIVAQVGVGLGANYPHLYELTGAVIASWANRWSPLYLQLASPVAGLLTLILVYHTALRLSRSVLVALTAALLVRCVPYLITYHIYASNYSFAILFCAAFFYCALRYIEDGLAGYLALATLCAAFAVHINYLMWALWICWAAAILLAHWPRRLPAGEGPRRLFGVVQIIHETPQPAYARVETWPSLWRRRVLPTGRPDPSQPVPLLRTAVFRRCVIWGGLIASIWYVRNWMVTGNPVYAFFTGVFRASRHVNPEVMASAVREWQSHGDGIGIAGEGLARRLAFTWFFFVNNPTTCWKWAPVFVGAVVPGILIFLAVVAWQIVKTRPLPEDLSPLAEPAEAGRGRVRTLDAPERLGLVALLFVAILFAYHYVLAPFYLYHLVAAWAAFGVFLVYALGYVSRWSLRALCVWALWCGVIPGLPMAMMGQKLTGLPALRLTALRNPGMAPRDFYALRYGKDPQMWDRLNALPDGTAILTHENRALVLKPTLRLVHMDDWEVQKLWGRPAAQRLEGLRALGVRYYLEVPYEFDHPINARLGHRQWVADGTLRKVYQAGDSVLYRFPFDE